MDFYHGTTKDCLRSIRANGLHKGSFVSPDLGVARHFANARAEWNKQAPVVLCLRNPKVSKITLDRHGRKEARLTASCLSFELV